MYGLKPVPFKLKPVPFKLTRYVTLGCRGRNAERLPRVAGGGRRSMVWGKENCGQRQ